MELGLVGSLGMVCWSRDGKGVSFSERTKRMVWGGLFCYCVRVQLLDTIVIRMYVCVYKRFLSHTGTVDWEDSMGVCDGFWFVGIR